MINITGLDSISRELKEAQRAFAEIDGELGTVNFDPDDPASIERAVQAMEEMIDRKLGQYAANAIVGPFIEQIKEQYRQAIIDKAAESRLANGEE